MRWETMVGAWSAGLLGLAAPAMATDPVAEPTPASPSSGNGSADGAATPGETDGTPSSASGRVLIMTLSKPRPEPAPRTASDAGELSKHALAKRPPGMSN